RGDAYALNSNSAAPTLTGDASAFRALPAAGVTVSYPLLARSLSTTQIIEPKAQIVVRPNEMGVGTVPNHDAQRLVYEVGNLFDQSTLAVNRAELEATAALGPVTASAAYFYLRQAPNTAPAVLGPASVVHAAASVNLTENWRAFGSFAYDVTKSTIASNSLGF